MPEKFFFDSSRMRRRTWFHGAVTAAGFCSLVGGFFLQTELDIPSHQEPATTSMAPSVQPIISIPHKERLTTPLPQLNIDKLINKAYEVLKPDTEVAPDIGNTLMLVGGAALIGSVLTSNRTRHALYAAQARLDVAQSVRASQQAVKKRNSLPPSSRANNNLDFFKIILQDPRLMGDRDFTRSMSRFGGLWGKLPADTNELTMRANRPSKRPRRN